MTIITIFQQTIFYVIILFFVGFGIWKAYRFIKSQHKEVGRIETHYLTPEGFIRETKTEKFRSIQELKGGFK
jgi:hypothetical protein